MSIYDQVGGQAVVKSAVTVFYNRVLDDESLARWFDGVDLSRLKAHQRAFLTAALDGPEIFTGRDLATAHAHMAITDDAFSTIIEHLVTALTDLGIDQTAIAAVGVRLQGLRSAIVTA
ncbi:group I truncated hemoglobin [Glaciihabitans arcticus]|nr:group 1 truncated hemoglobin [Glaciihabitans arcticus]